MPNIDPAPITVAFNPNQQKANQAGGVTSPQWSQWFNKLITNFNTQVATTPTISSGVGAPTTVPPRAGDQYHDTKNNKIYIAIGTKLIADWHLLNP